MFNHRLCKRLFLPIVVLTVLWLYLHRNDSKSQKRDISKLVVLNKIRLLEERKLIRQNKSTSNISSVIDKKGVEEFDCTSKRPKIKYLLTPVIEPNSSCDRNPCFNNKTIHWNMVIFVKSYAYNFKQRDFIRHTWGSYAYVDGGRFWTIFVLGSVGDHTQPVIFEEHQNFKDILQIAEIDFSKNTPKKTLAGMQWASLNLPEGFLYASGDADVLVDLGGVQENIDKYVKLTAIHKWPEFPLICFSGIRFTESPNRKLTSQDYVSREQFKWPYYPKFCIGGLYATSVKVAKLLYHASKTEELLNRDDAWVTGVLRMKIGMSHEMVLNVLPVAAYHYHKAFKKNTQETQKYLAQEWETLAAKIHEKPRCICLGF